MTKERILAEIRRTATENRGRPLGARRFATLTGIVPAVWQGRLWARWGDALKEAGFAPNELQGAYDTDFLLARFAALAHELGRLPTANDLRLKDRQDETYPNQKVFERLGPKPTVVSLVLEYCQRTKNFPDVATMCRSYNPRKGPTPTNNDMARTGYVYLLQHGTRREYKIGRTNNPIRREGEIRIELPHPVEPIHVIRTDDPAGVEAYWHRRFGAKRLKNEWFALSPSDVGAFKKWKRIH